MWVKETPNEILKDENHEVSPKEIQSLNDLLKSNIWTINMGGGLSIMWKAVEEQINRWEDLEKILPNQEAIALFQLYYKAKSYQNRQSGTKKIWKWRYVEIKVTGKLEDVEELFPESLVGKEKRKEKLALISKLWPVYIQYAKKLEGTWAIKAERLLKLISRKWNKDNLEFNVDVSKISLEDIVKTIFYSPKVIADNRAVKRWFFWDGERLSLEKALDLSHEFRELVLYDTWDKKEIVGKLYKLLEKQDRVDINNKGAFWWAFNKSLDAWDAIIDNSFNDIFEENKDNKLGVELWKILKKLEQWKQRIIDIILSTDYRLANIHKKNKIRPLIKDLWINTNWRFWFFIVNELMKEVDMIQKQKKEKIEEQKEKLKYERNDLKDNISSLSENGKKRLEALEKLLDKNNTEKLNQELEKIFDETLWNTIALSLKKEATYQMIGRHNSLLKDWSIAKKFESHAGVGLLKFDDDFTQMMSTAKEFLVYAVMSGTVVFWVAKGAQRIFKNIAKMPWGMAKKTRAKLRNTIWQQERVKKNMSITDDSERIQWLEADFKSDLWRNKKLDMWEKQGFLEAHNHKKERFSELYEKARKAKEWWTKLTPAEKKELTKIREEKRVILERKFKPEEVDLILDNGWAGFPWRMPDIIRDLFDKHAYWEVLDSVNIDKLRKWTVIEVNMEDGAQYLFEVWAYSKRAKGYSIKWVWWDEAFKGESDYATWLLKRWDKLWWGEHDIIKNLRIHKVWTVDIRLWKSVIDKSLLDKWVTLINRKELDSIKNEMDDVSKNMIKWLGKSYIPKYRCFIDGKEFLLTDSFKWKRSDTLMYAKVNWKFEPRMIYFSQSGGNWHSSVWFRKDGYSKWEVWWLSYEKWTIIDARLSSIVENIANKNKNNTHISIVKLHDDYWFTKERYQVNSGEVRQIDITSWHNKVSFAQVSRDRNLTFSETKDMFKDIDIEWLKLHFSEIKNIWRQKHKYLWEVNLDAWITDINWEKVEVIFARSSNDPNLVWVENIRYIEESINSYGFSNRKINGWLLTTKPLEYTSQIPRSIKNSRILKEYWWDNWDGHFLYSDIRELIQWNPLIQSYKSRVRSMLNKGISTIQDHKIVNMKEWQKLQIFLDKWNYKWSFLVIQKNKWKYIARYHEKSGKYWDIFNINHNDTIWEIGENKNIYVSREHLYFEIDNEKLFIYDISTNWSEFKFLN